MITGSGLLAIGGSFPVKPGEYKRIVAHEVNGYSFFLVHQFFENVAPNVLDSMAPRYGRERFPLSVSFRLTRTSFILPVRIIVDNEDEGFHLIDSSGNRLKRLAEQLAEDNMKDYNYGINAKKHTWGRPCIDAKFYGEEVHSAFTKVAGNGSFRAEWIANLPEAGRYEIFVYLPDVRDGDALYTYESKYPGMKNYYTVDTPGGSETVGPGGGKGRCRLGVSGYVCFTGRGIPPLFWMTGGVLQLMMMKSIPAEVVSIGGDKHAQLVVADAVKWVKSKVSREDRYKKPTMN